MPWWQDAISQAFNPPIEPGVDVATPFHTPITALDPGKVVAVSYGGFGGRVDVQTAPNTIEYYQHLDTIAAGLSPGAPVTAGEQLGLSGGQLSGGNLPNSPANSTGPHVEFGVTQGGAPVDPATRLSQGVSAGVGSGGGPSTLVPNSFFAGLQNAIIGAGKAAQFASDPAGASTAAFTTATAGTKAWVESNIIPLVVAGLIILVVLGTGQKTVQAPAPQIVPVPV